MAESSPNGGSRGFFGYYRKYAKTGVHAASAAALTAFGLFASFTGNRWFILVAIAVYVLPPVFLYLTDEGENVPSVVGNDTPSADGRPSESNSGTPLGADGRSDESDSGDDSSESEFDTEDTDSLSTDESTLSERRQNIDTGGDSMDESNADVAADELVTDDADPTGEPEAGAHEESEEPKETDTIEAEWTEVDTPTEQSLLDIVSTESGAVAVGEGGVVLSRDGEEWSVAVEDGPTANANPLRGVDATADGETVWFAGDSGVLGRFDGRLTDHSAPKDQTSTWEDVAVTGKTGTERIHLVNGSGELLRGNYDGGSVSWGEIEKPGSGSSIAAIDFTDDDRGHLCDTNQSVSETTDGGETYEEIGIEDANAAFTGVAATDSMVVVAGDDGSLFRYDGAVWTRLRPSENPLSAVDLVRETGLAAGDAGAVFELADGEWERTETPTDADLAGVVCGGDGGDPDVAVGTAGTVIERRQ